ncbi:MAG TPA: RNA polymerase sigma factor [Thermoanaerobaculia bacterium]|nr:RNA polymerase sigma factor [Thermoanaerobaculia bacterium]
MPGGRAEDGALRSSAPEALPAEAVLVARALKGDQEAIEGLVRAAAPAALAAARRVTGDAALAEDACQEAFLRAFRALGRFRPEASFRAWLRTIAVRCAIDVMRRRRPDAPLPPDPAGPPEDTRHEDTDLLRAALAALSPLEREILLARELEGVDDKEIARRLDMTVTAVRVRIHRARRRVRQRFERERP